MRPNVVLECRSRVNESVLSTPAVSSFRHQEVDQEPPNLIPENVDDSGMLSQAGEHEPSRAPNRQALVRARRVWGPSDFRKWASR